MERSKRSVRGLAGRALVAGVLGVIVGWPQLAQAFNPQPEPPALGMVGLARLQTARFNVVNLHPPDPGVPPDPDVVCTVTLGFVNGAGQPFLDRTGRPIVSEVRLEPGQAAFLDLRASDAFLGSDSIRMQFRATADWLPPIDPDSPDPCAATVGTLEIFDNLSGRTMLLHAPEMVPPVDPDRPSGQ